MQNKVTVAGNGHEAAPAAHARNGVQAHEASVNLVTHPVCLADPKWLTEEADWHRYLPLGLFLVDYLRPRVLVEVGTRYGDSYCAFCQAVGELGLECRCYGFGRWGEGGPNGSKERAAWMKLREHHDALYGDFSRLVEGTAEHTASQFGDGTVDVLHLHGYDSRESIKRDFLLWLPKLSARAVVLVHGTEDRRPGGGTAAFWDEVKDQYPHARFGHGPGLGILAVGPEAADSSLFRGEHGLPALRRFLDELGGHLSIRAATARKARRLKRRLGRLSRQGRALRSRLSGLEQTVKTQKVRAVGREVELERLRQRLEEQEEALSRLAVVSQRLARIEGTVAWKLSSAVRRRLGRILPERGPLGRVRGWLRRCFAICIDEGPRAVAVKGWRKLRRAIARRLPHGAFLAPAAPGDPAGAARHVILHCEEPPQRADVVVFGSVLVRGWAVAASGIRSVEVRIDDQPVGLARYGSMRLDVGVSHPHMPDSERSGYRFTWNSMQVPDGHHSLSIRAVARTGRCEEVSLRVRVDNATPRKDDYQCWIELHEEKALAEAVQFSASLARSPLISVVMPNYNTEPHLLERAVQSVRRQTYQDWELCLCDDGSTKPGVHALLESLAGADPRIKITYSETNAGIAGATNRALSLATGEYVALMDSDDELAPFALYEVARFINDKPDADLIYSDEDKISVTGKRYDAFFKPDWSPDLFLSCNYLCHLTTIRASLLREVGGFRSEYDGSQDYDVFLRVAERTPRIYHIPKILYHWRAHPSSTASTEGVRPAAHEAARRALTDHLDRQHIAATVTEGVAPGRWRIKYHHPEQPAVSVILPTGGNTEILTQCVRGLAANTAYQNFDLVIVDNSRGDAVQALMPVLGELWKRIEYTDCRHQPFNYSTLNNQAARHAANPLLLFLNDDTVPINADWLGSMVEHALRKEVGAVGAKLLYPDDTIQHAGVVMGLGENTNHAFKNAPDEDHGVYFFLPHLTRNCSAVTAACLLTRRDVFWEVGGFDEVHLKVAFQDVDLCLKMREKGYLIVCTPHARLYHHEAKTKAEKIPNPYEVRYMKQKWFQVIARDPYYNPNLTRAREDYSLALS